MSWIPVSERLPTIGELRGVRPYWKHDAGWDKEGGYREAMVWVTLRRQIKPEKRTVSIMVWVEPPQDESGLPLNGWLETTNGKGFDAKYILAWQPIDVPEPYRGEA